MRLSSGVGHTRVERLVLVDFEFRIAQREWKPAFVPSLGPQGEFGSLNRRKADPAELRLLKEGEDVKRGGAKCDADCGANDYVTEEVHA